MVRVVRKWLEKGELQNRYNQVELLAHRHKIGTNNQKEKDKKMKFKMIPFSEEYQGEERRIRLLLDGDGGMRLQYLDRDNKPDGSLLIINSDGTLASISNDGTLLRRFSLDREAGLKLDEEETINPGTGATLEAEKRVFRNESELVQWLIEVYEEAHDKTDFVTAVMAETGQGYTQASLLWLLIHGITSLADANTSLEEYGKIITR